MMDWFFHHAPTIATVAFFLAFIGIAFWAYAPGNKAKLQERAFIPFKE